MAEFSSRGPSYDGRIKPEIVAPGQNIVSSRALGKYDSSGLPTGNQCGAGDPSKRPVGRSEALLAMQGLTAITFNRIVRSVRFSSSFVVLVPLCLTCPVQEPRWPLLLSLGHPR